MSKTPKRHTCKAIPCVSFCSVKHLEAIQLRAIEHHSAEKEMSSVFIYCWGVSLGCIINWKCKWKKFSWYTMINLRRRAVQVCVCVCGAAGVSASRRRVRADPAARHLSLPAPNPKPIFPHLPLFHWHSLEFVYHRRKSGFAHFPKIQFFAPP